MNTALLSDSTYNKIKSSVQLLIPAICALYLAIAGIWGLPYSQQIVGTLTAIATFLGVLLKVSTKSYDNSDAKYDGKVVVEDGEDGQKLFSLELNDDPLALQNKESVTFKVHK